MSALVQWTEEPKLRRWTWTNDCPLKSPPPAFGSVEREELVASKKKAIESCKKLSPADTYRVRKLQLEILKTTAILAPIRIIPFETLSHIFLYLGPFLCPEREHGRKLTILSLTCKTWHHCVMETPAIWSEIRIRPRSWSRPIQEVFDKWLPRARQHPLNIQVDHAVHSVSFLSNHAGKVIEARSAQIAALDLRLDYILPADLGPNYEFIGKCINLVSLNIWLRTFPSIKKMELSLPRLRYLALPRNDMGITYISPQLRELTFIEVEGNGLLNFLDSISTSYPELRSLTIGHVCGPNSTGNLVSSRAAKPSFSELRYLRCGNIPAKALHHVIQYSPMLNDLNAHITYFTVSLSVSFSIGIVALTLTSPLNYVGLQTSVAMDMLANMPHLKTITLPPYSFLHRHPSNDPEGGDATMSILATLTSRLPDGLFVCPGLEVLKCFSPTKVPSRRFLDVLSQIEKGRNAPGRDGTIAFAVGGAGVNEVRPKLTVQVLWGVSTRSAVSMHQATLEDVKEVLKDYPNLKGLLV